MTPQEIDLKKIKAIEASFTQLSHSRLEKMLSGFNFSQSDVIKTLPLLFHVNHPMMPGYIDKTTPCGLPNYFPSNLEKKIAKTISRSFKFETRAYLKFEIAALFLMGSTGTLAQSIRSDLDLWICLAEQPEAIQFGKLQKKAKLITEWMAGFGIELNCYLVHQAEFSQKKSKNLTKDSCGDTQNFLLLDEFYRTAIWLCGRKPLWWIVPPQEDYSSYAKRLITDKQIDQADWIDFGEVLQIPPNEYFSAALWQLYKAIESPYKSSIKLLILEIYARYFPRADLLSSQFKNLVYQGEKQAEKLDPYLLILQCAEKFLNKQPQRLEFLKRAFYLKAGSKINLSKSNKKNWRYWQIYQLVLQWQWNQSRLDYLNSRPNWRINSVIKERQDLVRELTHSYHFLSNFARVQGVLDKVSQKELMSLGRKLYAVFERRSGKIDCVNNGIAKDITEPSVTLQHKNSVEWQLLLGPVSREQLAIHQPVFRAQNLFEVLAWGVCNRVIVPQTNFQVYSLNEFFSRDLMNELVKSISALMNDITSDLNDEQFQKPAANIKLGIYLNTDEDPFAQEKSLEFYKVVEQQDWFCWGDSKINVLAQFDLFFVNSWGEYSCKRYHGEFAWIQLLHEYRELLISTDNCWLFCHNHLPGEDKIKRRLQTLFTEWLQLVAASQRRTTRYSYLMSCGKGFLRINFTDGQVDYHYYKQLKTLLLSLADSDALPQEYSLDLNLGLPSPIKRILAKSLQPDHNIYFIQKKQDCFDVVITDPQGAVFYQGHQGISLNDLTSHYQQFFDSVNRRIGLLAENIGQCGFWQLPIINGQSADRFRRIKPQDVQIAEHYSRVQAIGTTNSDGKICYDLYSTDESYCYRDYGELGYRKLAQLILKQRAQGQNYPIFLTDLDLTVLKHQPRLIEFFEHKRGVEEKLQRALSQLSNKSK